MKLERTLCTVEALIISCVLLGALGIQFFKHEEPCVLCFLQRFCMTGIAICMLHQARHLPHRRYYGFALLFALLGGGIAFRQIALHICPNFPTFGFPFWGLSLYTWAFLVFACTVGYNGLLLMIFTSAEKDSSAMNLLGHLTFGLLSLATLGNILAAFQVCGIWLCSRY